MPRRWPPIVSVMAASDRNNMPAEGFDSAAEVVAEVIMAAGQHFDLCSHFLTPQVFDTPKVVEALRKFAAKSPKNRGRLLIIQPRLVTARAHPFVQAAQKFPETFSLHAISERITPPADDFLMNDQGGGLRFPRPGHSQCVFLDGYGRAWLQGVFDELWRLSEPVPELRQFVL